MTDELAPINEDFKTGKRETAFTLLGVWLLITLKLFLWDEAEMVPSYEGLYGALCGIVGLVVTGLFAVKGYEVVQDRAHRRRANPRLSGAGETEGVG